MPGQYDRNFYFICKNCSPTKTFQLIHEVKTREGFASSILRTLQLRANKKFIPLELILELMQEHNKLVRVLAGDWKESMMKILTQKHKDNSEYFVPSKNDCWGFPDTILPPPTTKGRKRKSDTYLNKPNKIPTKEKEDTVLKDFANPNISKIFFRWSGKRGFFECLPTFLDLKLNLTTIRKEMEENHIPRKTEFHFTYQGAELTKTQESNFTIEQCLENWEVANPSDAQMILVLKKVLPP